MKQFFYRFLIELTNSKWSSLLIKKFANSNFSTKIIPSFSKVYEIDLEEAEKKADNFASLHDFFVRKLKSGAREIQHISNGVISPVDAVIEDIGKIKKDKTIIVKGKTYSIEEMLGTQDTLGQYDGGTYLIFYLSPKDYHRIHSPIAGEIIKQWTLGGKSYPVNKYGLKYGKSPLSKNYRTISEVRTASGQHVAVVKVGAMFINSIILSHGIETVSAGEEIAYFSFGSTVVLLFEKDALKMKENITAPYHVKMGELIGEFMKE